MLTLKFDGSSNWHVKMPRKDEEIIEAARAYVARESALPPAEQLAAPALSLVQAYLTQAEEAVYRAQTGERERAKAYGRFRQALPQAKKNLKKALSYLRVQHWDTLDNLEDWGFNTVLNGNDAVVHLPEQQDAWIKLLGDYVAHESSLPPAEQVPLPPLAEMQALHTTIQSNYTQRAHEINQRITANAARGESCDRLNDLLQAALAVLVAVNFGGEISPQLRDWGFTVTARSTSTAVSPAPESVTTGEELPAAVPAGAAMDAVVPLTPVTNGVASH